MFTLFQSFLLELLRHHSVGACDLLNQHGSYLFIFKALFIFRHYRNLPLEPVTAVRIPVSAGDWGFGTLT